MYFYINENSVHRLHGLQILKVAVIDKKAYIYGKTVLLYYPIFLTSSSTFNIISKIAITSGIVQERWSFLKLKKWKNI